MTTLTEIHNATARRYEQHQATVALNEEIMRYYREGYRVKVIASRLEVPVHRVQRVARSYVRG